MTEKNKEFIRLLFAISHELDISPPETTDLLVWWNRALEEMDDYWLDVFYENDFCNNSDNQALKRMRQALETRVFAKTG